MDLLGSNKLDALFIDLAAELAEHIRLVVLATETNHEHGTCIRMMNHITQNLLGVLVVITKLGAAVVMRESEDVIRARLLAQTFGTFLDDTIDATYSRNDPYFVADTHLPVLAAIAHEGTFLVRDIENNVLGVILIREQSGEVGLDIVLVHPTADFLSLASMSDGETVLDNILTLSKVTDGYLMPGRDVFKYRDLLTVHVNNRTRRLRLYSYNHIIGRIDF